MSTTPCRRLFSPGCGFTPCARSYVGPKATPPNVGSKLLVLDTERLEEGWSELPSLPGTPRCGLSLSAVGGKLFVLGGLTTADVRHADASDPSPSGLVTDCWSFDPATTKWSRLPDIPFPADLKTNWGSAFLDRFLILVGGSTRTMATNGSWWGEPIEPPAIPNGTCGVERPWPSEYASTVQVFDVQ